MATLKSALELLSAGLEHQRAGRLEEAARIYEEVLACEPENPDALHLKGMLFYQRGDFERAVEWIGRAVRACPAAPMFHNNLGTVLIALGRLEQACACYRRALELDSGYAEAHSNLGSVLQQLGELATALEHHETALRLAPDRAEAYNNYGNALRAAGRLEQARKAFERALQLRPDYAEAWLNLSSVLRETDCTEEAERACRRSLECNPQLAEAHANLSAVLLAERRFKEAEEAARRAIRLKPQLAEAHANLAAALIEQRRFGEAAVPCQQALRLNPALPEAHANMGDVLAWRARDEEALACYEAALRLRPDSAEFWNKRGFALEQLGRWEEALECFEQAVRRKPDFAEARTNRAMAWLRRGDFVRGFAEYEWRFRRKDFGTAAQREPRWRGEPLEGRTILIHAEQGLGDTIQFMRYLPLVEQRGGRVKFNCQPRLRPLAAARWTAEPQERAELHASLLSLPHLLGTTAETIPAAVPYLEVASAHVERWRQRLGGGGSLKVGLVWAGNPRHPQDRRRSVPPELLAALGGLGDVRFFSLQRGWRARIPGLELEELEEETGTVLDTAAAILNLDLVISVDTMAAHLAGALGRRVWLLLSFCPDWRWMLEREDTPWYPTMRLFRQRRPGDWREVIARVAEALRAWPG